MQFVKRMNLSCFLSNLKVKRLHSPSFIIKTRRVQLCSSMNLKKMNRLIKNKSKYPTKKVKRVLKKSKPIKRQLLQEVGVATIR